MNTGEHHFFTGRLLCTVTATLLALSLLLAAPLGAAPKKGALILFDDSKGDVVSRAGAVEVANLLGHFRMPTYIEPVSFYEKGDLAKYSCAFFAGCQKEYSLPAGLLDEILAYNGSFFWIGNHIEQLLARDSEKKLDLCFEGRSDKVNLVEYRGTLLDKPLLPPLNILKQGKKVKVSAWGFSAPGEKHPYILRNGSFWYIADIPFSYVSEGDRYLAFCDTLHDFLGTPHGEKHQAAVRIEDVNPTSDPERIKEIADMLSQEKIPFIISLVPLFIDPDTGHEIPLTNRLRLVRALRYAATRGGSMALHGCTHQYKGKTAIDSEFWDGNRGTPVEEDSTAFVEKRLTRALNECFTCNLYPLLWETPQYVASTVDYGIIARHFSTVMERRMFFNQYSLNQSFPFLIEKDFYGQRIVPEYLGYIPFLTKEGKEDIEGELGHVKELLEIARKMKCLRDGVAGFFFHPFVDSSVLKELVRGLARLGYTFLDVRDLNNTVTFQDKAIVSGRGEVRLTVKGKFLKENFFDENGRLRKEKVTRGKVTATVKRSIACRPRWIYAAEGIDDRPGGRMKGFVTEIAHRFTPRHNGEKRTVKAAMLWNDKVSREALSDQQAFLESLEALGITPRKVSALSSLHDENLVVIPSGSAPQADLQALSKTFFERGGILVLDGMSELSRALCFSRAGKVEVKGVKDVYNGLEFFTAGAMDIVAPREDDKVIYQSIDGFPLGVVRKEKEGGICFLSTLYDPVAGKGYNRFPTLIPIVLDHFSLLPPSAVPRLEAFFDPGFRQNMSVEVLAQRWRRLGIRAIHAAAWHFYPSYKFDYRRLIGVCHKSGIAVYAWLELPYHTPEFWERHRGFREKNYLGRDLKGAWRLPVALEDKTCMDLVKEDLKRLFTDYDFDGVNLAEIYLEGEGPGKPEMMAPFHPSAQKAFKSAWKFDMRELFNDRSPHYWGKNPKSMEAFYQFREDLVTALHRDMLIFLNEIKEKKGDFDIVVTVVDSIKTPVIRNLWGVNARRIIPLMEEYPFTLSVEDPQIMWNRPPDRYRDLCKAYLDAGVPFDRLAMDLNIVDVHTQKDGFACRRQTGAELFSILRNASQGGLRVVAYAESSIPEGDMPFCQYALSAPEGAVFPSPSKDLIEPIKIKWASGDLLMIDERGGEAFIDYMSPTRCYIALNKEPRSIWVDDTRHDEVPLMGTGEYIVALPTGSRKVKIVGEGRISFDVEVISYHEARFIVLFGSAACGILLVLYLYHRVGRRRQGV
ncbi:MAG: polysaccharide deacetylase family protein [Candidatus Eremiobacteraeota bacterium]|nr:polysaccharide deacetylase family protein [Candidatus Eremiobacteraeota bacterium]